MKINFYQNYPYLLFLSIFFAVSISLTSLLIYVILLKNIASNSILIKFGDIELYSSLPWKTKFRYLSLSLLHIRAIEAGKEIPILVFRGSLIFSGARRKFDFSFVVKFDMRTFCFFFSLNTYVSNSEPYYSQYRKWFYNGIN